jgi:hypothetical protein
MPVIDVSGLPEAVVHDLQKLVDTLRSGAEASHTVPARKETVEEWIARFQAWVESHPKSDVIADDSRESIYEGRGE